MNHIFKINQRPFRCYVTVVLILCEVLIMRHSASIVCQGSLFSEYYCYCYYYYLLNVHNGLKFWPTLFGSCRPLCAE